MNTKAIFKGKKTNGYISGCTLLPGYLKLRRTACPIFRRSTKATAKSSHTITLSTLLVRTCCSKCAFYLMTCWVCHFYEWRNSAPDVETKSGNLIFQSAPMTAPDSQPSHQENKQEETNHTCWVVSGWKVLILILTFRLVTWPVKLQSGLCYGLRQYFYFTATPDTCLVLDAWIVYVKLYEK